METNNIFNVKRLYLLMRRQVFSNGKSLLIAFGGMAGVLLVISLLVAHFNPGGLSGLTNLYLTVMFIGGYIYTSNIYSELHQIQKSYNFLTLPVSTTERLASGWLITGIIFPVLALITMVVIIFLSNSVTKLTIDLAPIQSVLSASSMKAVMIYVVTQSVFLLGAAHFRKNNFLKTLLAMFLFSLVLNIYAGLLGWGLFNSFKTDGFMFNEHNMSPALEHLFMDQIPAVAEFVFKYLTLPFFLLATWFSLKEREV